LPDPLQLGAALIDAAGRRPQTEVTLLRLTESSVADMAARPLPRSSNGRSIPAQAASI